jgi:threonine dehydrogenase-like Zn-dependent dehydrogenase
LSQEFELVFFFFLVGLIPACSFFSSFLVVLNATTRPSYAMALDPSTYRTRNRKNEKSSPTANRNYSTGDRVALENGIPCSKPTCTACRTGRYHGCPDMTFFSSPPVDGTLRRYHAHPAAWLHRLPDSMTFEEGAMLEPLSVALAGIERSGLRLGDPLVICGAGPIGLVSLLAAHAAGAAPIVITDLDESRLEMAERLVPRARTVKVESGIQPEEMAERIKKALRQEAGLVLECTGVESSIHSAIYVSVIKREKSCRREPLVS